MKALLSTTLVLSAVTLGALAFAGVALAAVILAASPGFAADVAIPPNFVAPEFQGSVVPNRLDVYDLRRELAREAEHRRIHIRLGDPGPWCRPVAISRPGMPYPGSPGCW
jgi:hypothetical protein